MPEILKKTCQNLAQTHCLVLEAVFGVFWPVFSMDMQVKINIKMRKQLTFFYSYSGAFVLLAMPPNLATASVRLPGGDHQGRQPHHHRATSGISTLASTIIEPRTWSG